MPRPLRIEYEGAIYHVMSRGDRCETIFSDDADRKGFLETLGEACPKTDWCGIARRLREETTMTLWVDRAAVEDGRMDAHLQSTSIVKVAETGKEGGGKGED